MVAERWYSRENVVDSCCRLYSALGALVAPGGIFAALEDVSSTIHPQPSFGIPSGSLCVAVTPVAEWRRFDQPVISSALMH